MPDKPEFNYTEQDECPRCGSVNAELTQTMKGTNILLFYRCRECGQKFIDCYGYDSKGM